jgi:hypothetical protein
MMMRWPIFGRCEIGLKAGIGLLHHKAVGQTLRGKVRVGFHSGPAGKCKTAARKFSPLAFIFYPGLYNHYEFEETKSDSTNFGCVHGKSFLFRFYLA